MMLYFLTEGIAIKPENYLIINTGGGKGGGGGRQDSTNFYTWRLRSEVRPLTLLYTIFYKKGTPFVYLLLTNGTPFTYLV